MEDRAGFPTMSPMGGTMEEWREHEATCKKTNLITYKFVDFLDTLQNIVLWVPDRLHDLRYYLKNRLNQSHLLKTTQGKPGQWCDLPSRIPDALFTSVIEYVEGECAHMELCMNRDDMVVTSISDRLYGGTPRSLQFVRDWLRRHFPGDRKLREQLGRAWLNRYTRFSTAHGEDYSQWMTESARTIAVYEFAKNYFERDEYQEAATKLGYEYQSFDDLIAELAEDKHRTREFFSLVNKLDAEYEIQVTAQLKTIIELRHTLWT